MGEEPQEGGKERRGGEGRGEEARGRMGREGLSPERKSWLRP